MNITSLYKNHSIYIASPGDKHFREGWVNTPCPFCTGTPGNHLGFNLDGNYFYCWRCGGKNTVRVISELTRLTLEKSKELIKQYGGDNEITFIPKKEKKTNLAPFTFPSFCEPLEISHKRYLQKRGFDPDYLEEEWELKGTGPISKLDNSKYNHRIIAPIYWDGEIVSFQGRDITDRNPPKYKDCPKHRELIEHQTILYKHPFYTSRFGIAVEGIADVWRIGRPAFATFGISVTQAQVKAILQNYDYVVVWFDPERQAQNRAKYLMSRLQVNNVKAVRHVSEKDPGDTAPEEINIILEKLLT
jgi:hypothetical protein